MNNHQPNSQPTRPKRGRPLSLERIEGRLQTLIEDNLTRLLDGRLQPQTLARRLARALEEGIRKEVDGLSAPDLFTVILNADDMEDLTARYSDVASRLAEQLATLAADWHLNMNQPPRVVLFSDIRLDPFEIDIKAERTTPSFEKTQQMEVSATSSTPPTQREATLVLAGGRQIALDRPVLNIGRRTDNHIMVDDKRVSRQHCQIRLRFGRFVIYDLGSKGGTQVNGLQVKEHILKDGDVVSLAGFQMVYTEDRPSSEIALELFSDTQSFVQPDDVPPDGDSTL